MASKNPKIVQEMLQIMKDSRIPSDVFTFGSENVVPKEVVVAKANYGAKQNNAQAENNSKNAKGSLQSNDDNNPKSNITSPPTGEAKKR